jgi:hypothetical protein
MSVDRFFLSTLYFIFTRTILAIHECRQSAQIAAIIDGKVD